MQSALTNEEDAHADDKYANGLMVDYESLPNAVVTLAEQHFKAPLTATEEAYALEVGGSVLAGEYVWQQ